MNYLTALEKQLLSYPRVEDTSAQEMLTLFDPEAGALATRLIGAISHNDSAAAKAIIAEGYADHCTAFGDALLNIATRTQGFTL